MTLRTVTAHASGLVLPFVSYVAVQNARVDLPGVAYLAAVLVATAIATPGGFTAAILSAVLLHSGGRGEDLADTVFFLAIASSIPFLSAGVRRNADRLRRSEHRYRVLVEQLPVGIYIDAPDTTATNLYSNPKIVEMLGYPAERWVGDGDFFASVLHPDDRERVMAAMERAIDGRPFDETYRLRAGDGSYRWILDKGVLVRDADGEPLHIQGVLLDVTEAKAAEAGAESVWRRYQSLVEDLPIVTYIEDAAQMGKPLYVSPQIEELLGYPRERWLGSDDQFFAALHPDDHDGIRQARASGDRRTTQEFRLIAADGTERWVHSERSTVNDANGTPLYVHGLWIDLTERRELELRLRQKDRLDAVGELAGGVAHDFNNMLLAIRGRAQLAAGRADIAAARADLDVILASADRSAELVRRLLAFSGRQTLQPRKIDICGVIDELLQLVSGLLGAAVEVVFAAPSAPVIAFVDQAQIEQVIVNLAVNARDAMPAGGRLIIAVRDLALEPDDGAGVMIAVTDTGTGIRPDVTEKIFEPFFTTKEERGSGLGLATAHGIIQQSGGHIRVAHTALDQGTTFEIFLPSQPFGSS